MLSVTAGRIHNGKEWLPPGATLEITGDGRIAGITYAPLKETTHYAGVLAPGFVNAHCHLELSHMKGAIAKQTGLIPFLKAVTLNRNNHTAEEKATARRNAYHQLLSEGVVAVGDIANSTDTIDVRAQDKMHIHTFVESIGFNQVNAARSFGYALQTYHAFAAQISHINNLRQSITPHAPYSVSRALFGMIDEHAKGHTISIHNQESKAENDFYKDKTGDVLDLLAALNIDHSEFMPTGTSSLPAYLEWLPVAQAIMFVHNTFTKPADIHVAHSRLRKAYWCLCPNANLYIEGTLPDVLMLVREGAHICVGTDSLASNDQLSVLAELETLKSNFPSLEWEVLLNWATYNGALALQMSDTIGSLETGKKPGIVQLEGLNAGMARATRLF